MIPLRGLGLLLLVTGLGACGDDGDASDGSGGSSSTGGESAKGGSGAAGGVGTTGGSGGSGGAGGAGGSGGVGGGGGAAGPPAICNSILDLQITGSILAGTPARLTKVGSHLYVAAGGVTSIFDVSTPATAELVGHYDTASQARDADSTGTTVFVAESDQLTVLDVSTATAPTLVGTFDAGTTTRSVDLVGSTAFVIDQSTGLHVVDVSSPASPSEIGTLDFPGSFAQSLAIQGDYAYVADGNNGLRVVDISTPASPVEVGLLDTPGTAYGVALSANHAYVADDGFLRVVDVATPSAPAEVGSLDLPGTGVRDVVLLGQTAYLSGTDGLFGVDISTPTAPVMITQLLDAARAVLVDDNHAYVATHWAMQVLDITDPTSPTLLGTTTVAGQGKSVAVTGDTAVMLGLTSIDIGTPTPQVVGFERLIGYEVAANNGVAVLSRGNVTSGTAHIFDLSTPSSPTLLTTEFYSNTNVWGVDMHGDVAWVMTSDGASLLDLSNPANPSSPSTFSMPSNARAVAFDGARAYVVGDDFGMRIADITTPTSPTPLGSWEVQFDARDVGAYGDIALVSANAAFVVDVSDPMNPTERAVFYPDSGSPAVTMCGPWGLVGTVQGLEVMDFSDPDNPVVAASYPTPGEPESIVVQEDRILVAAETAGLLIYGAP